MRHTHVAAATAADSTAEQAVLTWLFFLLLLPLGLGLVGQQLGLSTAAGEGVAGTVAGVGLGRHSSWRRSWS